MKITVGNSNRWRRCTTLERCLLLVSAFAIALPINQMVEGFDLSLSIIYELRMNTEPVNKDLLADSKPKEICYSAECIRAASDIIRKINNDVKPCDDFYQFACGNYIKETEIPDDKTSVTTLSLIADKLQEQLREIIEEERPDTDSKLLKLPNRLYTACMNEALIESLDSKPMEKIGEYLGGWPVVVGKSWDLNNTWSWPEAVQKSSRLGFDMDIIFDFSIAPDMKNSTKRIINLDQSYTVLAREFLTQGFSDAIISSYYEYMVDLAVLFGAKKEAAKMELKESLQFEIELANISLPYEKRRNVNDLYNLRTINQLQESYPYIQWLDYIKGLLPKSLKVNENEEINVRVPSFFNDLGKLLQKTEKRVIANYIMWRSYSISVYLLSEKFRQRRFQFSADLSGLQKRDDRWKECLNNVLNSGSNDGSLSLGILVGSLYVRKHFKEESKATALEMVNGIIEAFGERIDQIDWMDPQTKQEAKKKLYAITAYIGYPDEILQNDKLEELYSKIEIDPEKYFESYLNINVADVDYSFSKLRKPVDKTEWILYGHTYVVNAIYSHEKNSIHFPAGILQGHYFNSQRPKYINYGTIGSVIGHEIIHGFDDKGRQYDGNGNLFDWWQPHTKETFLEKARCIIEQYGNFTDEQTGLKVNGVATQGENIADNGGIKMAYLAYNKYVANKCEEEPRLPGLNYTPKQLFWISAAQTWYAKRRTEIMESNIRHDEHAPDQFRVVGSYRNLKDFSNDFQCLEDAPMNPAHKCEIW